MSYCPDTIIQLDRSELDGRVRAGRFRRRIRHVAHFFGGCDGLISTALGRLRDGWRNKSNNTSATPSVASFHSVPGASPPGENPVRTDPGITVLTRMPSW